MTDKQFQKVLDDKISIYNIYMEHGKFHKELVPVDDTLSWIVKGWINTTTYYGPDDTRGRYVSEDQFDKQLDKFFKDLRKDYLDQIKEANKMLKKIDSDIESAKRSMIHEDTSDTRCAS